MPIFRYKLENGLDVVIIPKNNMPIVSIHLAYRVGSKDEKPGKTGMAHLFEHLMFEGSRNVPKGDFDKFCSLAGGNNNAYTTNDLTAYTMTLPEHQLELGLWLESDRMMNLSLSQAALETQQKVVTEEIHQTVFDTPYGKWREKLSESAYNPNCSYSWEVHGKISDVESVGLADLNSFFGKFYQPGNACLVICGNVKPAEGLGLVEKYFAEIPGKKNGISRNVFSEGMKKYGCTAGFNDTVPLAGVFKSFHCPGFLNDEILSGDILASIAGGSKSSRMYNSLVYQKQAASQVGAYVDKKEKTSLIVFYAIADNPDIDCNMLSDELDEALGSFLVNPVEQKELEKTINMLDTQIAHELQYSSGIADIAANQALFWDEPERIYSMLDKYRQVNIGDVNDFFREYIKPERSIRIDAIPEE